MAIRSYDFAYGRGRKQFSLDDSLVLKEIRTEDFAPMTDIKGGVLEAIRHPIGCPPLDEIVSRGRRSPSSATTSRALRIRTTSCRCSLMK